MQTAAERLATLSTETHNPQATDPNREPRIPQPGTPKPELGTQTQRSPLMKKTTTILTALIAIVSLGFSSTAAGSLLPVIDPGFETGASEQKTDVDQADASRGWFEAYGNSSGQTLLEFEQWEDQGNPDEIGRAHV